MRNIKLKEISGEGWVAKIQYFKGGFSMRYLLFPILFIYLLNSAFAQVEDEKIHEYVVVTANRFEEILKDVPFSVTVIDEKEMEKAGFKSLEEVLRIVSGLEIAQTGSKGHLTSVFIRGANSNHNLILLDGVPLNEPSSFSFDFSKIPISSIERIEILRGPQSAIWGTDAMGGVINIITKRNKEVKGLVGYGSDRSFNASFYGGSEISKFIFTSAFDYFSGKGNFENDDFKSRELILRAGRNLKNGEISILWRKNNSELGIPFNMGLPSLNRREKVSEDILLIPFRWRIKSTELRMDLSFHERKYKFSDPDDPWGSSKSNTESRVGRVIIYGKTSFLKNNTFFWGLEGSLSKVFAEDSWGVNLSWEKVKERAIFFNDIWKPLRNLTFQGGLRAEWNSQFGNHLSPRIACSLLLPENLRLRLSWGEGFRAPNPMEFAGPYGNRNLKPERSKSGELGLDQSLLKGKIVWNISFFENKFSNLISFDFNTFKMANLKSARSKGIELSLSLFPLRNLSFETSYTNLKTKDQDGNPLLRRPEHSFLSSISWSPSERINLYLFHEVKGKRKDIDEKTFLYVDNPKFDRTNLNLRFKLENHLFLSINVQNLFNKKIEEIYGYPSPDRSIIVNLELR